MTDVANSPQSTEQRQSEPGWVESWIHESDDMYLAHRSRGAEILRRIRDNQPLSPRETEVVRIQRQKMEEAEDSAREFMDYEYPEEQKAKILIENLGPILIDMDENPETYVDGEFAIAAKLSNERPTNTEGEQ